MIASKPRSCLIALAGIALSGLPALAQEEPPLRARKDCLSVELMMYSGRPRPQYLICEENEKKEALGKLADAKEEKPESAAYPDAEASPLYQGVLVTLPRKPEERSTRIFIRKGFLKASGSQKIQVDKDRGLELFFLNRSLKEKDISDSPTHGSPLSDQAEPILHAVKEEMKTE
jgi:hypothetical protein